MYKGQFKWLKRRERNKLRRINRELLTAEEEYKKDEETSPYLQALNEVFSEIFGEKIVFIDITSKVRQYGE